MGYDPRDEKFSMPQIQTEASHAESFVYYFILVKGQTITAHGKKRGQM